MRGANASCEEISQQDQNWDQKESLIYDSAGYCYLRGIAVSDDATVVLSGHTARISKLRLSSKHASHVLSNGDIYVPRSKLIPGDEGVEVRDRHQGQKPLAGRDDHEGLWPLFGPEWSAS